MFLGKDDMMIRIWFMCTVREREGGGRERETVRCAHNKKLIQLIEIEIETEIESAVLHLKVHFNYSKSNQIYPIQFQHWINLMLADFSLKLKLRRDCQLKVNFKLN